MPNQHVPHLHDITAAQTPRHVTSIQEPKTCIDQKKDINNDQITFTIPHSAPIPIQLHPRDKSMFVQEVGSPTPYENEDLFRLRRADHMSCAASAQGFFSTNPAEHRHGHPPAIDIPSRHARKHVPHL